MYRARDEAVPVPPPFEIVLRGFDRQQVIDHVDALNARVETTGAERDAALQRSVDLTEQLEQLRRDAAGATAQVDRLRREAKESAAQVDRLERSPLAAATARIQRMLQMAEDEAAELQLSAEQEATALRESVRAETEVWISDYQTRSIAALYVILQLAAQRLSSQTIEVKRQATALRRLRAEITDQVAAVHRLLVEAVGLVDRPSAAEHAEAVELARAAESSFSLQP